MPEHAPEHVGAKRGQEQLEDRRRPRATSRTAARSDGHAERGEDGGLPVGEQRPAGHDERVPQRDPSAAASACTAASAGTRSAASASSKLVPSPGTHRGLGALPRDRAEQRVRARTACARAAAPARPSQRTARHRSPRATRCGRALQPAPRARQRGARASRPLVHRTAADRRGAVHRGSVTALGGAPRRVRCFRRRMEGGIHVEARPQVSLLTPRRARSVEPASAPADEEPAAADPRARRSRLDPPPGRWHRRERLRQRHPLGRVGPPGHAGRGRVPGRARSRAGGAEPGRAPHGRTGHRSFPRAAWAVLRGMGRDADVVFEVINGIVVPHAAVAAQAPRGAGQPSPPRPVHRRVRPPPGPHAGRGAGRAAAAASSTGGCRFSRFRDRRARSWSSIDGIPAEHITIAYCGIGPGPFGPGERSTEPRLLYVGRLKAYKRIELLLDMLIELPGVTLDIAGQGDHGETLDEEIARRGLGVARAGARARRRGRRRPTCTAGHGCTSPPRRRRAGR